MERRQSPSRGPTAPRQTLSLGAVSLARSAASPTFPENCDIPTPVVTVHNTFSIPALKILPVSFLPRGSSDPGSGLPTVSGMFTSPVLGCVAPDCNGCSPELLHPGGLPCTFLLITSESVRNKPHRRDTYCDSIPTKLPEVTDPQSQRAGEWMSGAGGKERAYQLWWAWHRECTECH